MIFEQNHNNFTDQETYSIIISTEDNLEPFGVAECFKEQYPKKVCVISFGKTYPQIEIGLLFVGMNLKQKNEK